ncbi:MAG: CPBP family intramembrane glutamic endopeptidase [Verrucomicrobiales bacterium]|jgi:membrane protease YdiL (CAAX protease family)|tara:strand:+ start:2155 stop:2949 length:795 start_codon:yes stop_codon:yes gene_type:complete
MEPDPSQPSQVTAGATPPPPPSAEKSPWNGWWTLLWAVLLFIASQIIGIIGIMIAAFKEGLFTSIGDPEKRDSMMALSTDGDVAGLIAFSTIFFVCPACWFIGKVRPGWSGWEYLGNTRTRWWHWPVWGAATLACTFLFGLVAPYIGVDGPDDSMVRMSQSTQVPLFLILGVAIGAPLVEEFMFRGALWRGWRESRLGLWGTLFFTSFCWAVLHIQYPAVLIAYIFCLGLVLGLAREKTGNLWIPVWMHALNNGLASFTMLTLE